MKTGVTRREIASASKTRGHLGFTAGGHGNKCADSVVIGVGSLEQKREKMILGGWLITEQGQRIILGDDHHVRAPVIVDVADRESARKPGDFPGSSRSIRH